MKPCRIAIVEDESIVAMQIEERLIAMGYELAGRAASGEEALVIVEQNRPDLILMDIRLQGGMDGIAAAEEVRRRFHLPVIFLTAYSEEGTLERAKLAEPFGYILKPFDDRELRSTIEIALYKHAAEEEIRRLNRLYDVLSQVNQVIVRIESREELLQEVCRIVVERGAVDVAWFGQLDPITKRIDTVARCGERVEALPNMEFYADERPEGQGNPGKAVRENKPFICNDCVVDGCLYPLAYAPVSFGLKSCGSFPIHFQGRIYGTLNVGVARAGFFQEREIALLEEVAGDVSFALDKIEADAQRERAEVVLRESQSRLEALFAAIPDVIVEFDTNLRPVMANQAALKVLGYSSLDFTRDGAVSKMRFSKLDRSPVEAENLPTSRALNGDIVSGEPYSITIADGTEHVVLVYAVPLYKDGAINGVVGLWHDITHLKQTEDALRLSEKRFRSLFETSRDSIVLVNRATGRILDANAASCQLYDYSRDELLSMKNTDLSAEPEKTAAAVRQSLSQVPFRLHRKKDGTIFPVEITAGYFTEGALRLHTAFIRDITERKQAEEELRESEQRFKSLVEGAPEAIFVQADSRFAYVNRAALNLFGASRPEELLDKEILTMVAPEYREAIRARIKQQIEPEQILPLAEREYLRFDGSRVPVEVTAVPFKYKGLDAHLVFVRNITERKQAARQVEHLKDFFQTIIESIMNGVWVSDTNDTINYMNRAMGAIAGIPPEQVLGRNLLSGFAEETVGEVKELYLKAKETLMPVPYEAVRVVTPAGRHSYQSGWFIPIIRGGDFDGIICTVEDITERKEMEDALEQSRIKLEAALASMMDAVFISDVEGRFIDFNDAFATFHRFPNKEACYKSLDEYHDCIDVYFADGTLAPLDMWAVPQALRGETATNAEYMLRRKDTGETWVGSYSFSPIRDKDGRIVGSVVVGRDVTDRKRIEEALRQSEEMYRTLITASPDAIVVTDLSGLITVVSRKALDLFGIPSEQQALGRSIWEWFTRDNELQTERAMQHLATKGQAPPAEFVLMKDNGAFFDAEVHASPLRSPDGTVWGAILIIRDVTERKNLQAQLLQSQKMEAIGTLAGGIAHDFNNILMALMGYTGILAMKIPDDHPLRRYVDQIHHCAGKAASLTQSLLAFSRKQAIELRPQTANAIVRDIEKLLRRIVPEDVELIIVLNEDVTIMADMTQIDQVLINLVSNARDAMPKGGTLHIETGSVQIDREFKQANGFGEPGRYALISVTDTGSGMDETTQKKIFEPFFTTKDVGKGTGLGLSIVYGIIKQHGGYITVLSEPRRGTTFHIYLPAAKAKVSETKQVEAQVPGGTETILVAEDDSDIRRITGEILRTSGYTVMEAKDGEDAVKQYIEHRDTVDLLILDVVMPGMNGKEAYEKIRRISPSVRAIFMSGYTRDVVLDKGVHDTALDYISKPASTEELLKAVRDTLDR